MMDKINTRRVRNFLKVEAVPSQSGLCICSRLICFPPRGNSLEDERHASRATKKSATETLTTRFALIAPRRSAAHS